MYTNVAALASVFLSILHTSNAAPANEPTTMTVGSINSAQATCQVTLCTDVNYGGSCVAVVAQSAQCVSTTQLPAEYSNSVSTFGIDDGCVCALVTNQQCQGIGMGLQLSGSGDANLANDGFNDVMGSYLCNR